MTFQEHSLLVEVWCKGTIVRGYDPALVRKDAFGNWIMWLDYGDFRAACGWEIDHIRPARLGGSDEIWNLRPLHCRVNRALGGRLSSLLQP